MGGGVMQCCVDTLSDRIGPLMAYSQCITVHSPVTYSLCLVSITCLRLVYIVSSVL